MQVCKRTSIDWYCGPQFRIGRYYQIAQLDGGGRKVQAPLQAIQPAIIQRIKLMPTLPAPLLTRAGVLKIPLPICWLTTRPTPLQYDTTFICSS